jgi:hypothetical protein
MTANVVLHRHPAELKAVAWRLLVADVPAVLPLSTLVLSDGTGFR